MARPRESDVRRGFLQLELVGPVAVSTRIYAIKVSARCLFNFDEPELRVNYLAGHDYGNGPFVTTHDRLG